MKIYLKADIDKKKFQMALLHLETLNVSKNGNSWSSEHNLWNKSYKIFTRSFFFEGVGGGGVEMGVGGSGGGGGGAKGEFL